MPRRHLLWILLAFAVSVGVRAPLLDRPLSGHHEYCTALVLIVLHNWQADGFMHHHGAPAITFTGPADLIPASYTDAPGLRDGVLYYLSHPPLAYDLPHLLFTLTGSAPNVLGLQLFNLFFHLLTAVALYLIVRELLANASASNAPFFAAMLYLFMPAPLWFHSNVFMSDMFVQNAWVWHVLVVLRMYRSNAAGWMWPLLAGLTLFITTCISWPGVWAGVVLFGVALLRWWRSRDRQELRVMLMAVLSVGLALGYTAWRWLQVVDADALVAYFTGRYADRGTVLNGGAWSSLKQLLTDYRRLNDTIAELEQRGRDDLLRQGVDPADIRHRLEFDMRYGNQRVETAVASEVERFSTVQDVLRLIGQFHRRYGERFGEGSQATESGVRINTVRVASYVAIGKVDFRHIQPLAERRTGRVLGTRPCHFVGIESPLDTPLYDDAALAPGVSIDGPAVITTRATTYLVEPGWNFHASNHGAAWFTRIA